MAIIYTFPDLGAVDGSEKLLVTDGTMKIIPKLLLQLPMVRI